MRLTLGLLGIGAVLATLHEWRRDAPGADRTRPTAAAPAAPPPAVRRDDIVLLRGPSGHFVADARVNAGAVRFVVDTGATTIALSQADARRAGIFIDPTRDTVIGRGASGNVHGQSVTIASLELGGRRAENLPAVVLRDGDVSLLGQPFLATLDSVRIERDRMTLR